MGRRGVCGGAVAGGIRQGAGPGLSRVYSGCSVSPLPSASTDLSGSSADSAAAA